ncbi:hypothetical protein OHB36_29675 [Streptomyces sp. NBC_00320]|uniref:hypothetical protein n=1 Tax=unclassified Streptomyces TaxID=2593676 RepID=UPI0022514CAF|nr:hypothetical protein [Streptomyces sp. NBC_00320]MCX5150876.1 hypothetical protein [Streptomyces sp. NBC_00320]
MSTGPRRVLLAPVTATPTKALTPSHVKFLLWTDVMYRATALLADVTYRCSHTTYHPTEQTLGFWEYLDRTRTGDDYAELTEAQIGERYVAYRAEGRKACESALRPYAAAVEQGWVHPVSRRVLHQWTAHYERLGMHDPGLLAHQPPGLGLEEALERLAELNVLVDLRPHGGPVHLDLTRHGLPLRQIVGADGRPNYLACALRELLPLAPHYDEVVLLRDPELDPDYQLLHRVLELLGTRAHRFVIGRVPIDGAVRSARHGDWRGHDVPSLLAAVSGDADPSAVRLGLRLYFIAVLGPGPEQSLRYDLLHQCVARAERLLADRDTAAVDQAEELLTRHRRDHLYVNPYQVTAALFGRRRPAPPEKLLAQVYL